MTDIPGLAYINEISDAADAVYEAGRKVEQEGSDDISDADDYLRSLEGNYQVRA